MLWHLNMKFHCNLCFINRNDSSTYNLRLSVVFCYKSIDAYAYKVFISCVDRNFLFQVLASDDIFTMCHWKQFSPFQERDYRNIICSLSWKKISTTSPRSFGSFMLWPEIYLELQQWRESSVKLGQLLLRTWLLLMPENISRRK